MPTFALEYKVSNLYSDTSTAQAELSSRYSKKGWFTLVPSEYLSQAPCPDTKCEHYLRVRVKNRGKYKLLYLIIGTTWNSTLYKHNIWSSIMIPPKLHDFKSKLV